MDIGYIYTLGSHLIPEMLKNYLKEKEGNRIKFSFGQGTTKQMIAQLKDGVYDFVFASYVNGEKDLEFYPITKEELVLIVPKDHPLAGADSVDLKDTIDYPYIAFSENSGLRPVISQLFAQIKCQPKFAYEGV